MRWRTKIFLGPQFVAKNGRCTGHTPAPTNRWSQERRDHRQCNFTVSGSARAGIEIVLS